MISEDFQLIFKCSLKSTSIIVASEVHNYTLCKVNDNVDGGMSFYNLLPKFFFNGLQVPKWKTTQLNFTGH